MTEVDVTIVEMESKSSASVAALAVINSTPLNSKTL